MSVNTRSSHRSSTGGLSPLTDRVLFIDGEAIIIDKPAGLPVDPPRDGGLSLENHLSSLTFGFERWPVAVHRLDRDTSGCLLLARNPKSAKRFTEAFEARQVAKTYLAVLNGVPTDTQGIIDIPLGKTSTKETGWRMEPDRNGKSAVTHWQVLAMRDGRTLVRFVPETGRTHQLRAHSLHGLGLSILGDPIYRTPDHGKNWEGGMLLHARSISVIRANKAPVAAIAPVPSNFGDAGFADAAELDKQPQMPDTQTSETPAPETSED